MCEAATLRDLPRLTHSPALPSGMSRARTDSWYESRGSGAGAALREEARLVADRAGLLLRATPEGLELARADGLATRAAGELLARPRQGDRDPLWRSVLAGKGSVVDATAGLGADAFHLAAKGASVTMIERSPVLAALLDDAIRRAVSGALGAGATKAALRLRLLVGEAATLLADPELAADVVYLDPMFATEGGKAAPPKGMALLRALFAAEGSSSQAADERLLDAARRAAAKRVVVKRSLRAEPLAGARPSGAISGRTVRYDLYPPL